MATIRAGKGKPEATDIRMVDLPIKKSGSSSSIDSKDASIETLVRYENSDVEFLRVNESVVANMEDIALKALHTDDDVTLNPWTFRMFFLGIISHDRYEFSLLTELLL
jgi:hypothetical protein